MSFVAAHDGQSSDKNFAVVVEIVSLMGSPSEKITAQLLEYFR